LLIIGGDGPTKANEGADPLTKTTILRATTVIVACVAALLAAQTSAMALTVHSATDTTTNSAGQLVATAKCAANEHVVSGGFKSSDESAAVVSHALHGDSWTVHLYPGNTDTLTVYAYCAHQGQIYRHTQETKAGKAPINTTATAHCASGQTLVSGGYAFLSTPSSQGNSPTYRDFASTARKWLVMATFETIPAKLEAFAYCEQGVVVKVRSNTSDPIPDDNSGSATARCHKGETLLSGGYRTTPTPDWNNNAGPDLFYDASFRSGTRAWTARAHNYSGVAGKITAFAYCEP
jgi:hypothetical protein